MLNRSTQIARDYYAQDRTPLLDLCPDPYARVLEIGCGNGSLLVEAKRRGAQWVCGIELEGKAFARANEREEIDRMLKLDFERDTLPFSREEYDLVIASHVVEHFQDPWKAMVKIGQLLRPKGSLLLALPNMRQVSILWPLVIRGKWEYAPNGILDWTHMRFFTRSSTLGFLKWAGLEVRECQGDYWGRKSRLLSKLSLGVLDEFGAYAYNIHARKPENWKPPESYPFGGKLGERQSNEKL
jgi:SAM-dependent methyltransferase